MIAINEKKKHTLMRCFQFSFSTIAASNFIFHAAPADAVNLPGQQLSVKEFFTKRFVVSM
jgi:hypothetical protein